MRCVNCGNTHRFEVIGTLKDGSIVFMCGECLTRYKLDRRGTLSREKGAAFDQKRRCKYCGAMLLIKIHDNKWFCVRCNKYLEHRHVYDAKLPDPRYIGGE